MLIKFEVFDLHDNLSMKKHDFKDIMRAGKVQLSVKNVKLSTQMIYILFFLDILQPLLFQNHAGFIHSSVIYGSP